MHPVRTAGPSVRGEAIGNAGVEALHWIGVGLNYLNEKKQRERLAKAKADAQQQVADLQAANPEETIFYIITYQQIEGHPDSPIQPGPTFVRLELAHGRDFEEAMRNFGATSRLYPGVQARTAEWADYEVAARAKQQPAVIPMPPMPFPGVALATFADRSPAELQDVEWTNMGGFDDEGTTPIAVPPGFVPRFYVLQVPETVTGVVPDNSGRTVEKRTPARTLSVAGGTVPGVGLDPLMPFSDVVAVCIFPADRATLRFFSQTPPMSTAGILPYDSVRHIRWVRPEQIRLLTPER
jgi:hypothetical protein